MVCAGAALPVSLLAMGAVSGLNRGCTLYPRSLLSVHEKAPVRGLPV